MDETGIFGTVKCASRTRTIHIHAHGTHTRTTHIRATACVLYSRVHLFKRVLALPVYWHTYTRAYTHRVLGAWRGVTLGAQVVGEGEGRGKEERTSCGALAVVCRQQLPQVCHATLLSTRHGEDAQQPQGRAGECWGLGPRELRSGFGIACVIVTSITMVVHDGGHDYAG